MKISHEKSVINTTCISFEEGKREFKLEVHHQEGGSLSPRVWAAFELYDPSGRDPPEGTHTGSATYLGPERPSGVAMGIVEAILMTPEEEMRANGIARVMALFQKPEWTVIIDNPVIDVLAGFYPGVSVAPRS